VFALTLTVQLLVVATAAVRYAVRHRSTVLHPERGQRGHNCLLQNRLRQYARQVIIYVHLLMIGLIEPLEGLFRQVLRMALELLGVSEGARNRHHTCEDEQSVWRQLLVPASEFQLSPVTMRSQH
jgi:hypothetical protein